MGIKINQYPLERLTFGDDDFYDIDYWDGATYQTAKIKGSTIKAGIESGVLTIYENDGTLSGARTVDMNNFSLGFTGGSVGIEHDLTVFSNDPTKQWVATFIASSTNAILAIQNAQENVGIGTSAPRDSAKLEVSSNDKGILIPRLTTTQRNNITITTGEESLMIYNTTTNQFEYVDSSLNWVAFGGAGAVGKFGITDSAGEYTYYDTIELALAGASSGDVIEQFANVSVSTASSITLDKDITWNMNGYEYKNTSTSSFIMLNIPNNTTIDLTINNGKIIRNTGAGNGGVLFYLGNQIGTKVNSNGVIYHNVEGQSVDGKAEITGGTFKSDLTSGNGFYFQGIGHKIKVISNQLNQLVNTQCRIYHSYFYASVDYTFLTGGSICYNTTFESPASYGVRVAVNCEIHTCIAKGLFGAIFAQGGKIYNSTGISSGGFGIELSTNTGRAYNCIGISPATNGFSISGLSEAYNCTALATSGYAVTMQNDGKFKNGVAVSTYNNAGGHGFYISSAPSSGGFEITGNEIITTNASANGITGAGTAEGKWAHNIFKGMTTTIGLSTANLLTNTTDNQGNILL